jgi:hypothetical protein
MPASPTRATILVDDAPVTILPRRAPVGNSGPIRGRTLAIFPTGPEASPSVPDLVERQADAFPATVEPGGQSALAVADLTEAETVAVGQALGLGEILFWDGRRARLLACDDPASIST